MAGTGIGRRPLLTAAMVFLSRPAGAFLIPVANRVHFHELVWQTNAVLTPFWLCVEGTTAFAGDRADHNNVRFIPARKFGNIVTYASIYGRSYENDDAVPLAVEDSPLYLLSFFQGATPAGTYSLPLEKLSWIFNPALTPPPLPEVLFP
jgi:hypothetical protein